MTSACENTMFRDSFPCAELCSTQYTYYSSSSSEVNKSGERERERERGPADPVVLAGPALGAFFCWAACSSPATRLPGTMRAGAPAPGSPWTAGCCWSASRPPAAAAAWRRAFLARHRATFSPLRVLSASRSSAALFALD